MAGWLALRLASRVCVAAGVSVVVPAVCVSVLVASACPPVRLRASLSVCVPVCPRPRVPVWWPIRQTRRSPRPRSSAAVPADRCRFGPHAEAGAVRSVPLRASLAGSACLLARLSRRCCGAIAMPARPSVRSAGVFVGLGVCCSIGSTTEHLLALLQLDADAV